LEAPISFTAYVPAGKVLVTPETTGVPLTDNGKLTTVLVPPLSLMTILTTVIVVEEATTAGAVVVAVVVTVVVAVTEAVAGGGGGVPPQVGAVMVSVLVVTVPPNANALPVHVVALPTVIPEASMLVPTNVELAPSVVAAVGVQNTSQADAPAKVTTELETLVKAPLTLKMYVPEPLRVIPAVPMDAALEAPVQ
jgi:hypothetical protein